MSPSYFHASRISLVALRTFRGSLFPKPVTGQELFSAVFYSQPAIVSFHPSYRLFLRYVVLFFFGIAIFSLPMCSAWDDFYILHLFNRSCIYEQDICEGVSVCPNKNDLKLCQSSLWGQPDTNLKPLSHYLKCPLPGRPNVTGLYSQQILDLNVNDTRVYHCFNRGDENPFSPKKTDNGKADWLQLVKTPCEEGEDFRRCLGYRPDKCVRKDIAGKC